VTPITCDDLADLLDDLLNDTCAVEVRGRIEIHLGVCPDCGGLVAACRATFTISRALPKSDPPLPAGLADRLRQRCGG
jgi:predicted anti-sigma-YlaC factor YlaD